MNTGTVVAERFQIECVAGRGGMGVVYRATDLATGAPVALKIIAREASHRRFEREAEVLAELRHPGIVRYLAHGQLSDGQPYIAMEWVEGETLADRLARGVLSPDEAVTVARRLAEALDVAHRRGVVHRDIKPGNVALPDGSLDRLKLLDFGLARPSDRTALTETGAVLGTPSFMAPEQARGGTIDARTDVFAIGCVLFKCLTGRAPFVAEGIHDLLMKIVLEDPPLLMILRPELSEAFDDVVSALLAKEPSRRPRDARAVVELLDAALPREAIGRGNPQAEQRPSIERPLAGAGRTRIVAGRFRLGRRAGSGGMGVVYEAEDAHTGGKVALKLLTSDGESAAARFSREGALLAEIAHPHIVRYVAHGETDDGEAFLAMEWLDGCDLSERLGRAALTLAEAVTLCTRIAQALGALHARGVVHRDVKPSNVFLVGGAVEAPKLLDFGIARALPAGGRVTRTGTAIGTPGYMAPEQVRGDRSLDARSDVFSLGCVLFECLTGRAPFVGEHAIAILARIILEPAPAPSALCSAVSPALDALVLRMLAKDAGQRPEDGSAVARALADLGEVSTAPVQRRSIPPSSLRPLTASEQRMISLVLGGPGGARTLPGEEVDGVERGLDEVAKMRGARLETLADGSLVVAFVEEGAATDRAASVARAALLLRELFPSLPLSVATGRMLRSSSNPVDLSMGDAVDRAARALAVPSPTGGRISIDSTTAGLLDARFELAGGGEALELVGERSASDETRTVLGKRTKCVGRERELAILLGLLEESAVDAVARCAVVIGPPGIGKSRIRQEFVRRVERREEAVTIWVSRADAVGKGSPFAGIAQLIRRAAGIVDGEPILLRQARLAACVAEIVAESERARITEFLAELAGAPFDALASTRIRTARTDAALMGDEMRRAFEDFVAAACATRPLLIVLEDLHWGDRPTVLWIDAILRNLRDAPLLVVALARPEIEDVFPRLWSDRSVTEIHVSDLSRRAGEQLARDVLGPDADAAHVSRIVERAGGNAFYLEELIRAAGDGPRQEEEALPETVLAMVHARLSALEPEARLVLRAASVFGQVFSERALDALLGKRGVAELGASLEALVVREFIERRSKSGPSGQEYAFRHAIVRDAAYAMLTGDDLRMGHRQAGTWLERSGEADAMVLAEHFELGGKLDRAAEHLRRAAEQALEGNDFDAVFARVEQAKRAGATGELLGRLLLIDAEAKSWRNLNTEVVAVGTEALALLPEGSPAWFTTTGIVLAALYRLSDTEAMKPFRARLRSAVVTEDAVGPYAQAMSRAVGGVVGTGDLATAEAIADEMARTLSAQSVDDMRARGMLHSARQAIAYQRGDTEAMLDNVLAHVRCLTAVGDLRCAWLQSSNVGYAATEIGQYELAEEQLRRTYADGPRMGLAAMLAPVRDSLGRLLTRMGKLDEAKELLERAVRDAKEHGHVFREGHSRWGLAAMWFARGDLEAAEAEARIAVDVLASFVLPRRSARAFLARVLVARGELDEALAAARLSVEEAEKDGADPEVPVRLALVEALLARGEEDAARVAIEAAEARVSGLAARIKNPVWRASFLENVEENRRVLQLARALPSRGSGPVR